MGRPPGAFQRRVLEALNQAGTPRSRVQLMLAMDIRSAQKVTSALEGLFNKRLVHEDYQDGFTKYSITKTGLQLLEEID